MSNFDDLVPIPPRGSFNAGLSSCREDTMLSLFGKPGSLTPKCSKPSGTIAKRIVSAVSVGPFKVTGMDYAVESLSQVMSDVSSTNADVIEALKTAGMLCVRAKRHNPTSYSNHSWGCAIDLYFGRGVVPMGTRMTQRGFLTLVPSLNRHGWYWGAGFSGTSVDSMHFELADETVRKIPSKPLGSDQLVAAADYIAEMGYNLDLQDA